MNPFIDYLVTAGVLLLFVVAPFAIAWAVCRTLRTPEFSVRLGVVLLSISLALGVFASKILQLERTGYRVVGGDWVSLADVREQIDPQTQQPVRVHAQTGEPLETVTLRSHELEWVAGQWVLTRPVDPHADKDAEDKKKKDEPEKPRIQVDRRWTFDLARWKDALSFGIDLAGGTNLVYEVDAEQAEAEGVTIDAELMDRLVGAVNKRVNPGGTKEIVVRRIGQTRIEIILPGADPAVVEETKQQITLLGSLEFSIVADVREADHKRWINQARANPSAVEVREGSQVVAKWRPIAPAKGPDGRDIPNTEFDRDGFIALRQRAGKPPGYQEILIVHEPDLRKQITGKLLKRAHPTMDRNGMPAVGFQFNQNGAFLFNDLTTRYKPRLDGTTRRLAVMLNGEVHTAPSINSPIGADGIIESGRFTNKEVDSLVAVLNAGALPVPIKQNPISEFSISPTLGVDVQTKGTRALWVSSIAVILFMAVYYFTAGLVADFALLLNLLFIVAIMALVKAAFTLPGLAGLVLSAGMAVDANVLIYERMREELGRGASLRMAIHNGFDKAFVAIFDSNITSLITAAILYMIGTETVKGFAVSLFIGLAINLYTAVYVSRLIMNILERSRLVKKLRMLSLVGVTNFDFVGKQMIASAASILLIVAGLGAFIARGAANWDIDFSGGTSITMQFSAPQQTAEVRDKLEKEFGTNVTVEELGATGQIQQGSMFRLRVANIGGKDVSPQEIEQRVNRTFPDQLLRKQVVIGELQPIAKPEKKDDEDAAEQPPVVADADRFAGGVQTVLSFTNDKGIPDAIATATFSRYLQERLAALETDGQPRYPSPENLFLLEGTAGPGMAAREGQVRLYTAMTLKVAEAIAPEDARAVLASIQQTMQNTPVFDELTSFESSVAGETKQSAVYAIIASLLALIAYLWFRFENVVFGVAAAVALAHDVLVTLGCVAIASYLSRTPLGPALMLTDFRINMAMIAAFLTIVGYSINDTIVIFDRLREVRGKNPHITREMINLTVNQTLSRTILTAVTVFITVLILYALGGEGIHGFAFCMVIGSIAGTYSTVYIAAPLVLQFMPKAKSSAAGGNVATRPAAA